MRSLRPCLLLPLVLVLAAGSVSITQSQEAGPRTETKQDETSPALAPSSQPEPSEQSEPSDKAKAAEQEAPLQAEQPAPAHDQASPAQPDAKVADSPKNDADAKTARPAAADPDLPPDQVTHHTLDLPDRTLEFDATAGSISLTGSDGHIQARLAFVSYALAGADPHTRPVAFVFNGGPGSSSAWLHLGTLGPWRLPLEGDNARPSAPGLSMPNADTWLDFTDLVMIDPVGTGYSRFEKDAANDEAGAQTKTKSTTRTSRKSGNRQDLRKHYWSISGDVESIASFISQWLTKTGRHSSPKVLVGESYGGFRAPKIAHELQNDHGVGVNLLVLVSPVLDYGFLRGQRHLPLNTVALLPSLAAAALEGRGKTPTPTLMREAEDYARGEYLTDLLRGPRDTAAVGRVIKRVTALTALPVETVQKYGGRLDSYGYRREANVGGGQVASAYDASIKGLNPEPNAPNARAQDPFMGALRAPLTTAVLDLYATKLAWRPQARYLLANSDVTSNWQYGNSPASPEAVSDLKSTLALDARLRVLVAHGYTDLVTPYFASTLVLDQLPAYGDARRVIQITYPGGHMFYSRDVSRAAFRDDVLIMLAASLTGEAQTR